MKVKDGAWLVDCMILGKCWLPQEDIKAKTNWERVFWDKFWGKCNMDNTGSSNSMSNSDTISDMEVLATLSGLQYQEYGKSFYLEVLNTDISSHLISKVPKDVNIQDPSPSFTWSTTGTNAIFKVKCSSSVLARWLCVNLVECV